MRMLRTSKAGILGAQGQADAAKATLLQAEANDAKAQADLARYKQLVAKQEISQQQYDQAVAAAAASAAGVVAARASASAAEDMVRQAQSRLVRSGGIRARSAISSAASGSEQGSVQLRRCNGCAEESGTRTSTTKFAVLHDRCARRRRRKQEHRGRNERAAGTATAVDRAARRRVGHRKFQRNSIAAHAPGAAC